MAIVVQAYRLGLGVISAVPIKRYWQNRQPVIVWYIAPRTLDDKPIVSHEAKDDDHL